MASMCALKHAHGHSQIPSFQMRRGDARAKPWRCLFSGRVRLGVCKYRLSGHQLWVNVKKKHSIYFLCVHDTVLFCVLTWMCPTLFPFTLCTARYSVFVTPLKHIHTYHTSYVSLLFTYLPYIIYLVLIPPPVIELYFSPTPSLFCHYIHMPCLPPMYAHPPNLCSL